MTFTVTTVVTEGKLGEEAPTITMYVPDFAAAVMVSDVLNTGFDGFRVDELALNAAVRPGD